MHTKHYFLIFMILSLVLGSTGSQGASAAPWPPSPDAPDCAASMPAGRRMLCESGQLQSDTANQPLPAGFLAPTAPLDTFGYQVSELGALDWITPTQEVVFTNDDEGYSTTIINIGFNFRFYENTYNQVYIGTNGLVTFGTQGASARSTGFNLPIPDESSPNNLIAAMWDDLELRDNINGPFGVVDSKVYYGLFNVGGARFFVIEWSNVVERGLDYPMTFEIILYDGIGGHTNGDIRFQYRQVDPAYSSGSYSVGIEDAEAADGLAYTSGVATGKALEFKRPADTYHSKFIPRYQGRFVFDGTNFFPMKVRNTSDLAGDFTYNLTYTAPAGWLVSFENATTQSPLLDTSGDGVVDTGPLPKGAELAIQAVVQAPDEPAVGDAAAIVVLATRVGGGGSPSTTQIATAVPAPFAQAYVRGNFKVARLWEKNEYTQQVTSSQFTGFNFGMAATPDGKYAYAWEQNFTIPPKQTYTELQAVTFGRLTPVAPTPITLSDSAAKTTETVKATAGLPAIAATSDGKIGIIWQETLVDFTPGDNYLKSQTNVYFATISPDNTVARTRVTNNNQWYSTTDANADIYYYTSVAATADNRFFLSWINAGRVGGQDMHFVYYAIYNSGMVQLQSPTLIAAGVASQDRFSDTRVMELSSNRVLVNWGVLNINTGVYSASYTVYNSSGTAVKPVATLVSDAWHTSGKQLSGGNILMAWTNPVTRRIQYAVLEGSGYTMVGSPYTLPLVGFRTPDFASVTTDLSDHAILTWMDLDWSAYLYYTLVNGDGSVVTPPMSFLGSWELDAGFYVSSYSGQGIAPYSGAYLDFLPTIRKK